MNRLRHMAARICVSAATAALVLTGTSCSAGNEAYVYEFFAADTYITLKLYDAEEPAALCAEIEAQTAALEKILSRDDAESELAKINVLHAGDYTVSKVLAEVVSTSLAAAESSEGAYDPTVAPLVRLWNIKNGGGYIPEQSEIDAALALVGYRNVKQEGRTLTKLADYTELDLGGSGKGYMLGKAVEALEKNGGSGVVSFGGNIGVYGAKPDGSKWAVAIKNPRDTGSVIGTVAIDSGFVSVSGDYERYFINNGKRYCHIFDPATGRPADNGVQSVAVWSGDALYGDLTSTALFVMGREKGLEYCEQNGVAALFVTGDGIFYSAEMEPLFTVAE